MIVPSRFDIPRITYPTSDGRPMAETDLHRDLMLTLIETLKLHYAADDTTYVSGNLLVFYERGNKRRHVSPDVFVVHGVPKQIRENYLIWEEGRPPEMVIELTSATTRREDVVTKRRLYQDVLKVREYFLFDPRAEYLEPSMQGYRLVKGEYRTIRLKDDRMPSGVMDLHLERSGRDLRLWNPQTKAWLPTPNERAEEAERNAADAQRNAADAQRNAADAQRNAADAQRQLADSQAEVARLKKLLAERS